MGAGCNFHANLPCGTNLTLEFLTFSSIVFPMQPYGRQFILFLSVSPTYMKSTRTIYLSELASRKSPSWMFRFFDLKGGSACVRRRCRTRNILVFILAPMTRVSNTSLPQRAAETFSVWPMFTHNMRGCRQKKKKKDTICWQWGVQPPGTHNADGVLWAEYHFSMRVNQNSEVAGQDSSYELTDSRRTTQSEEKVCHDKQLCYKFWEGNWFLTALHSNDW